MKAELWMDEYGQLALVTPGSDAADKLADAGWSHVGTVNLNLERSLDDVAGKPEGVDDDRR